MRKMRLGKTDLEVSRVGFGGIPIQRPPFNEAVATINKALDLGVNFIDTSRGYGDSEIRIGRAIRDRRDDVILATKGSWRSKESAEKTIEDSLKRLATDRIDLWQFHNIRAPPDFEVVIGLGGAYEAAEKALSEGKIKHLGLSTHNIDVAILGVESGLFETVMYPFDLVAREAQDRLIPLAEKNDVGFIAMKPFAGGNIRKAPLAIKYLLQFPSVQIMPGIEKVEDIEEIAGILEGSWEISEKEYTEIEEIRGELKGVFCRQCMYCMPCPNGVEIWLLTYLRNLHRLWPKEEMKEDWIANAAKSAEKCKKCGLCETKCPYNLPIREIMDDNLQFYQRIRSGEAV